MSDKVVSLWEIPVQREEQKTIKDSSIENNFINNFHINQLDVHQQENNKIIAQ